MQQRVKTSFPLWIALGIAVLIGAMSIGLVHSRNRAKSSVAVAGTSEASGRRPLTREEHRQLLFDEIQPVKLVNCQLERFGETNDGGYLLCANLLNDVRSGYSYGISGYDQWGCDVSRRFSIPVHQYDCFNLTPPVCHGGMTIFHEECVGGSRRNDESGRLFDTMANQFARNGDSGKRLVVKMDVEGSEWESFFSAPAELLSRIDQLAVEFHGIDQDRFLEVMWRLKEHFYVVNLHFNNNTCRNDAPFPAWVYEVLFVNKRIGVLDPAIIPEHPNPLDRPNNPFVPDCQL